MVPQVGGEKGLGIFCRRRRVLSEVVRVMYSPAVKSRNVTGILAPGL